MEATEIAFGTFALDPGARNHLESSGDPPVPALLHLGQQGEKLKQHAGSSLPDRSALDRMGQLAALNTHKAEIREEYRKLWLANDLDVCIAPPAQSTAVQHDTFGLPPYTAFLNTLDVSFICPGAATDSGIFLTTILRIVLVPVVHSSLWARGCRRCSWDL
jgi:amidase